MAAIISTFKAKHSKDAKATYRCAELDDGRIFVFLPRSRTRGFALTREGFDAVYERVAEPDEAAQWERRVATARKRLAKSGLWKDIAKDLDTLSHIGYDDLKEMRNEAWREWNKRLADKTHVRESRFAEKHPDAYEKTPDGGTVLRSFFRGELADCRLKSMYFGKDENASVKEEIARRLSAREEYRTGRIRAGYDVSFEYDAETGRAWYSEEYRDCGNGHYYLALDESTAIFCEDD